MAVVQDAGKFKDLESQLKFSEKLKSVIDRIHSANNITEILIKLKDDILSLFDADRITVYALDPVKRQLYSRYVASGDTKEIKEIRVAISPASLSGYTALSAKLLNIADAHDEAALKKIHPNLSYDRSWDQKSNFRTKQVICCPIIFENKLLGVIQLINKKTDSPFTSQDEKSLQEIAKTLGIAFRNQSKMVHTRFDHLISQNVVTDNELKQAMTAARERGKDVESILMEDFKVKKADVGASLGQFYGAKFVEYNAALIIKKEVLKGLNLAYLKKSLWVPISVTDGKAVVIIDNPKDPKTAEIKNIIKAKEIEFQVALKEDIVRFIDTSGSEAKGLDTSGSASDILAEMNIKQQEEGGEEESGEGSVDENASTIVRLVNQIIIDGIEKGASDVHVEPSKAKKTTYVRYRVDGTCIRHLEIPFTHSRPLTSRIKIMANLDISERRLPQDGKIKFLYKDKAVELRVATLPTVGGEDVVMRILAASEPMPLEALNLSEQNYKNFKEILAKPYGIVLVVGPTGSGKTTTLHAGLGAINTPERKIWTAEDPVEITQEGLRQVEVKPKIDFNFARAMRAFLRADPDVIMVGEMRDHETAQIGVEASLTGHLVFSTLHTNSAPETITRLIDMDIDPFNFADAILGILAQRLVRTLCKKCKEPYTPSKEEFDILSEAYGEGFAGTGIEYGEKLTLFRPKGCGACNQSGYKGRTGIHELLVGTKEIKSVIAKKSAVEVIRAQAIKDGMRTLYQDGIAKIFMGITDLKQVRSVCIQ